MRQKENRRPITTETPFKFQNIDFAEYAKPFISEIMSRFPNIDFAKRYRYAKPFIYDVTLRDGNQALKRPWNIEEKCKVFQQLITLNVDGAEVGFASASETDFEACYSLAKRAPPDMVISSLSRAVNFEIKKSWQAIEPATLPRIHIVLPVSRYALTHIIQKTQRQTIDMAVAAIDYAKEISKGKAQVQFSGEHFGDAADEGFDEAMEIFEAAIAAGADVINLPNTVERGRPATFCSLVERATAIIADKAIVSVHVHNDLGMATATTVESYFKGARQLEMALNGLGERAGNANLQQVAAALYSCDVKTNINMKKIYAVSKVLADLSAVVIHEKTPLVGCDIVHHRSGIHQDGVGKTRQQAKPAYNPFDLSIIGREETDVINFTSQSGASAIKAILDQADVNVSSEMISQSLFELKAMSDAKERPLVTEEIVEYLTTARR